MVILDSNCFWIRGLHQYLLHSGDVETVHYGAFEALGVGVMSLIRVTDIFLTNIWHIIIGEASFTINGESHSATGYLTFVWVFR